MSDDEMSMRDVTAQLKSLNELVQQLRAENAQLRAEAARPPPAASAPAPVDQLPGSTGTSSSQQPGVCHHKCRGQPYAVWPRRDSRAFCVCTEGAEVS